MHWALSATVILPKSIKLLGSNSSFVRTLFCYWFSHSFPWNNHSSPLLKNNCYSKWKCVLFSRLLTHSTKTTLGGDDRKETCRGCLLEAEWDFSQEWAASSGTGCHSPSLLTVWTLCVHIVLSYIFYFVLEWSTWIKWCSFWNIVG